jgi:hypothetical protein
MFPLLCNADTKVVIGSSASILRKYGEKIFLGNSASGHCFVGNVRCICQMSARSKSHRYQERYDQGAGFRGDAIAYNGLFSTNVSPVFYAFVDRWKSDRHSSAEQARTRVAVEIAHGTLRG